MIALAKHLLSLGVVQVGKTTGTVSRTRHIGRLNWPFIFPIILSVIGTIISPPLVTLN